MTDVGGGDLVWFRQTRNRRLLSYPQNEKLYNDLTFYVINFKSLVLKEVKLKSLTSPGVTDALSAERQIVEMCKIAHWKAELMLYNLAFSEVS